MKALILAAGMGNRLGALTEDRPKALVEVAGVPLIQRVLIFLAVPEISEIAVVGGFHYDRLASTLRQAAPEVRCIENTQYTLGSIQSLFVAREYLTDDFFLLNADHLYRPPMMTRLLTHRRGITAMCDFDRALTTDDMKITRNGNNCLQQIHKELAPYDGGYIGITYCPKSRCDTYWAAAEATRHTHGPTASVEWILGTLARAQHPVSVADCSGIGWAEVDTLEDLTRAEQFVRSWDDETA